MNPTAKTEKAVEAAKIGGTVTPTRPLKRALRAFYEVGFVEKSRIFQQSGFFALFRSHHKK